MIFKMEEQTEEEKNLYELGYLLNAGLKEEEILSFLESLRNTVTAQGGLIISEGKHKLQNLAYPIKKESGAYFNWIRFSLKPSILKEIKEFLSKQTSVLRYLVIKQTEETIKPPVSRPLKKKTKPQAAPKEAPSPEEVEEIDKKLKEILGE